MKSRVFFDNWFAVIIGIFIGGFFNVTIAITGHYLVQKLYNISFENSTVINATIDSWNLEVFIVPFLAHSIGTLVASFAGVMIVNSNHKKIAAIIGILYFLSGVSMIFIINAPTWFETIDLIFAYLPMAYLGYHLASKFKNIA